VIILFLIAAGKLSLIIKNGCPGLIEIMRGDSLVLVLNAVSND